MVLEVLSPRNPPNAAPFAKPAVAEPAGAVTLTVLRKLPPPRPPNSHCWAYEAAAAAVNRNTIRVIIVRNSDWLLHNPQRKRGGHSALLHHQRNLQAQRHPSGHRGIDLLQPKRAQDQNRVVDTQRPGAERD